MENRTKLEREKKLIFLTRIQNFLDKRAYLAYHIIYSIEIQKCGHLLIKAHSEYGLQCVGREILLITDGNKIRIFIPVRFSFLLMKTMNIYCVLIFPA